MSERELALLKGGFLLYGALWLWQKFRLSLAFFQVCRNYPYFPGLLLQLFSVSIRTLD